MSAPTIVDELRGEWHKIVGALLAKYGDQRLAVEEFAPIHGMTVVASHADDGRTLTLRLVSEAEGQRLSDEFQRAARRSN